MNPKPFDFAKLSSFQGSVLKELKEPTDYRSYRATCVKVVKLWTRCHNDEVFYPELISSIKEAAKALKFIGLDKFQSKVPENLIEFLEDIETANINRWLAMKKDLHIFEDTQVIVEESRERKEGTHCAFCRVQLHFPAYIVTRSETETLHTSRALGVKCLRAQQGKLKKLLNTPHIIVALDQIKSIMVVA